MSFLDESEEMKELKEIKLMGIYYDNHLLVKDRLRFVYGFSLDKEKADDAKLKEYLLKEGFKTASLPASETYHCTYPIKSKFDHMLALVRGQREILKEYRYYSKEIGKEE